MTNTAALVHDIRKVLSNLEPHEFNLATLAKELDKPHELLTSTFGSEEGLVEEILHYEQSSLEEIFSDVDFEDMNAIDGLLAVSREISLRFADILPSINFDLRKYYPKARQKFFDKRVIFVHERIRKNIEQGIGQGLYRPDLSAELISRIYISRLVDLHNPDYFPNEEISFSTLFDVMFDNFIRGICTREGTLYYTGKVGQITF